MGKVQVTIDGVKVYVPSDYTILEAAKEININIPTLCFLKDVSEIGCCRMCLVQIKGKKGFEAACVHPVYEGMEVITHSLEINKVRKKNMELILSNHPAICQSCTRSNSTCELQNLANKLGRMQNRTKMPERVHVSSFFGILAMAKFRMGIRTNRPT